MIFFSKDDYQIIFNPDPATLKKKYANVWKDGSFPQKQWSRVERQLKSVDAVPEFRAIIDCIRATKLVHSSILEIGCSSGYLFEVLQKAGLKADYEGMDYSPSFIRLAREKYPRRKFTVGDATKLNHDANSFDIVVSGCCLLHIVDYQKAIGESARVAGKFVIFHRTPVLHTTPTTFLTKTAYGREMLEIFFNEEELVDLFSQNNLAVVMTRTISQSAISCLDERMTMKNYLCRKLA